MMIDGREIQLLRYTRHKKQESMLYDYLEMYPRRNQTAPHGSVAKLDEALKLLDKLALKAIEYESETL